MARCYLGDAGLVQISYDMVVKSLRFSYEEVESSRLINLDFRGAEKDLIKRLSVTRLSMTYVFPANHS